VRRPGWDDETVARAQHLLAAGDPAVEVAFEHLDALFLLRVHVIRRCGGDVAGQVLEAEDRAGAVGGVDQHGDTVARRGVFQHSWCRHDRLLFARSL
jgi:hypothetical protein